jgi:ubiquinone/menaquinone biosynthesis C-methylase UbiE
MIKKAKREYSVLGNVSFVVGDLRNLKKFRNCFDVVFAINSVILPKISDVNLVFEEIYSSIKKEGFFVGVFPAMDSFVHYCILTNDRDCLRIHKFFI